MPRLYVKNLFYPGRDAAMRLSEDSFPGEESSAFLNDLLGRRGGRAFRLAIACSAAQSEITKAWSGADGGASAGTSAGCGSRGSGPQLADRDRARRESGCEHGRQQNFFDHLRAPFRIKAARTPLSVLLRESRPWSFNRTAEGRSMSHISPIFLARQAHFGTPLP